MEEKKECTKCGEEKLLSEFSYSKKNNDNLHGFWIRKDFTGRYSEIYTGLVGMP